MRRCGSGRFLVANMKADNMKNQGRSFLRPQSVALLLIYEVATAVLLPTGLIFF
jgi:hypothetical protein